MNVAWRLLARLLALLLLSILALQLYFGARVALMNIVDPRSTTFQRSEIWRLLREPGSWRWSQQWIAYEHISANLKRAVIASEDAGFTEHSGIEWDALERAWERNQKAQKRADLDSTRLARRASKTDATDHAATPAARPAGKVVGGSTISQQLAKNLFLAGERNLLRKGQEFMITLMLEALLSKQRILELYLNHVEWGEGVFGAEAAARHYFRVPAARLATLQAAQLAVMLPAPKRFEKRPGSPYVIGRAQTVSARMGAVDLP